ACHLMSCPPQRTADLGATRATIRTATLPPLQRPPRAERVMGSSNNAVDTSGCIHVVVHPRARGDGPDRRHRARCSSLVKSSPMPCCAHPTWVGVGRLLFWCSSVRVACGCPSAVLVSSRPANRTCVPHNPPLTVKAGRVSPQGLRAASAPVRRELSQGL